MTLSCMNDLFFPQYKGKCMYTLVTTFFCHCEYVVNDCTRFENINVCISLVCIFGKVSFFRVYQYIIITYTLFY